MCNYEKIPSCTSLAGMAVFIPFCIFIFLFHVSQEGKEMGLSAYNLILNQQFVVGSILLFHGGNMKVKVKSLSRVRLFATPRTVACQPPLSRGFSRQEYWSGLPLLSPGELPDPGIESRSPALQADALPSEPQGKPLTYILTI